MDRDELRVFCDLSGRRTDSEGTVPEELLSPDELLCITPSKRSSGINSQVLKPNIMFLSRSFRYGYIIFTNNIIYICKSRHNTTTQRSYEFCISVKTKYLWLGS